MSTNFLRQDLVLRRNTSASHQVCPKHSRSPLALTFPDTSLFIKVVKRLERKIDERLRSSTSRIGVNGLGFNEMQLLASFAECVLPPTIEGFVAVERGLTIAPNSLKIWWPGTESNRRRQPFQVYVMLYF